MARENMLFCVISMFTELTATIARTLQYTKNKTFKRKDMKKACMIVWLFVVIVFMVEQIMYHEGVYPVSLPSFLWLPLLSLSTFLLSIVCFIKMFKVMRKGKKSVTLGLRRKIARFLKISSVRLVVFVCSFGPLAVLAIISLSLGLRPEFQELLDCRSAHVLLLNGLLNPIVFLVEYRHSWRQHRKHGKGNITKERSVYALPRPPMKARTIR